MALAPRDLQGRRLPAVGQTRIRDGLEERTDHLHVATTGIVAFVPPAMGTGLGLERDR